MANNVCATEEVTQVDTQSSKEPAQRSEEERARRQLGEILRFLHALHEPGEVVELRALEFHVRGDFHATGSGYYTDWEALARNAIAASPRSKGTYITANSINPALFARRANEFHWLRKTDPATADQDVTRRRVLPVDCDPVRPSGICSTDAEHEAALAKAREIRDALAAEGWPAPILVDTGNGATLHYRVDLPPDDGGLIGRVLKGLAFRFDSPAVKVDLSMHNPARIIRLPGTLNRKGSHVSDRPHRWCRILELPA